MLRRLVLVVYLLPLLVLTTASGAQSDTGDFSIVLLPDTQNYSQYYPQIFTSQTQWIVDNVSGRNIRMVIGEGDIVNHDSSAVEWANAEAAAGLLDGKVPYTLAIGNHDYDNFKPSARGTTAFNSHFGPQRYAGYGWYGGNYNGGNENFYTFFTGGGVTYMVLALEFFPRDAVLQWANSLINSNPDKKVIIVTHSFEGTDGFRVDTCDSNDMSPENGNFPQSVWNKLVKLHPNIFLVVSGHLIGSGTAHRTDLGDSGNVIHQIFTNFQDWTNGGDGYLRILTFRLATGTIEVETYSPWLKSSLTTSAHQFTLPLQYAPSSTTGSIGGKVRNSSCGRLSGATVTAAGLSTTTDPNGVYRLQTLPAPGAYDVTANASGYTQATTSTSVAAEMSAQLDFYVSAAPPSGLCPLSSVDPSVTICSPAPNSTVPSPVSVVAGTTSSLPIQYMQVYIDGVLKGTFYAGTVSQSYPMTDGAHRVTVQAKNSAGTLFKSSSYVTVAGTSAPPESTAPVVKITAPVNNATVSSPFALSATATPASGRTIAYLGVYLDGTKVYSVNGGTLNTSLTAAAGSHRITVQAKDSASAITNQSINVTVGSSTSSSTSVAISSPLNGATVSSPFTVSASAKPGTGLTISYMSIYVDGAKVYTVNASSLSKSLSASAGTHRVTVQAKDSSAAIINNTINITVK